MPNLAHALDAARTWCLRSEEHSRRASDAQRSAESYVPLRVATESICTYGGLWILLVQSQSFMQPIVNLEEKPGKVVGKIKPRPPAETLDWLVAQFHALGLKLPFPKGIYRFKTFEEANAWDWDHMMRAAKKKFRDRLNSRT